MPQFGRSTDVRKLDSFLAQKTDTLNEHWTSLCRETGITTYTPAACGQEFATIEKLNLHQDMCPTCVTQQRKRRRRNPPHPIKTLPQTLPQTLPLEMFPCLYPETSPFIFALTPPASPRPPAVTPPPVTQTHPSVSPPAKANAHPPTKEQPLADWRVIFRFRFGKHAATSWGFDQHNKIS